MENSNRGPGETSEIVFSNACNSTMLEMDKINDVTKKTSLTVTVLGTGDFGRALTKRLSLSGYNVVMGSRSPESKKNCSILRSFQILSIDDACNHSEVVMLAIPREGYDRMVELYGKLLQNKIVVDVSNPTQASCDGSSHAEYLASLLPGARVVKGLNMVSAWTLENDVFGGSRQVFICGDDQAAKDQ
ncbi:Metalloreductase STEAP4, partial [Paramuricea clavata]